MSQVRTLIILTIWLTIVAADNGAISGLTFFEYRTDESVSAFELNRAYFTYQKNLSEHIRYKFQIDAGREKIPTAVDSITFAVNRSDKSRLYTYIKNAKLSWNTRFGSFIFGMQGMNMFGIQEKNWGYRFIEKSAMDKYKFSSSADLGIGYANTIGPVFTSLLITNGTGYKKAESDKYKKVSLNIITGKKKLKQSNGYNAGLAFSYEPTDSDATIVYGIFGATQFNHFRLGGEYDMKQRGTESFPLISFYGTVRAGHKLQFFGRIDRFENEESIITGINIRPESALYIAPTFRRTTDANGIETTALTVNIQFKI